MEFTLLWAALTGVGAAWVGTRIWRGENGDFDRILTSAVLGLASGRLISMVADGINPLTNLGDLFVVRGGVSTPAAAGAALLTAYLIGGRSIGAIDTLAPAALLGLAGWHAGCVWRSACLGTASDLPWSYAETGSQVSRHPVEIYAAILLILAALIVARLPAAIGLRAGCGLALASGARLATEPMRLSVTGGPVGWYVFGSVAGLVVVAVALRRSRRRI